MNNPARLCTLANIIFLHRPVYPLQKYQTSKNLIFQKNNLFEGFATIICCTKDGQNSRSYELCSKTFLWLAVPFHAEGREFFVEWDLLPRTTSVRLRQGPTGPGSGLPWPPYTSAASWLHSTAWGQPEESPVGHCSRYGITGFSAEHSKQYQPAYFSLHWMAFFLYGKGCIVTRETYHQENTLFSCPAPHYYWICLPFLQDFSPAAA